MSYYSLEEYKEQFETAVNEYHEMLKGENEASVLMKWIVENDIPPTIFLPTQWHDYTLTLVKFMELYNHLRWCLYDDGSVIFIETNHGPIIYFDCGDYSEKLPEDLPHPLWSNMTIKVKGYVDDSEGFVWGFMKSWEERHLKLIENRSRFKEWIPWTTYKENYGELND